jgi:hypothetical protein
MKQLKNKNLATNLICHPLAVPAFELTQAIFLSSPIPLSLHKLLLLSRARRFMCFERADGKYVFFSGWMPLLLNPSDSRKEVVKAGPSYIEFQAWLYALESILLLSSRNSVIENLAFFFFNVPDKVKARLFIGRIPNTTQAQIVEFTGESRASVRHYLRKMGSL